MGRERASPFCLAARSFLKFLLCSSGDCAGRGGGWWWPGGWWTDHSDRRSLCLFLVSSSLPSGTTAAAVLLLPAHLLGYGRVLPDRPVVRVGKLEYPELRSPRPP